MKIGLHKLTLQGEQIFIFPVCSWLHTIWILLFPRCWFVSYSYLLSISYYLSCHYASDLVWIVVVVFASFTSWIFFISISLPGVNSVFVYCILKPLSLHPDFADQPLNYVYKIDTYMNNLKHSIKMCVDGVATKCTSASSVTLSMLIGAHTVVRDRWLSVHIQCCVYSIAPINYGQQEELWNSSFSTVRLQGVLSLTNLLDGLRVVKYT